MAAAQQIQADADFEASIVANHNASADFAAAGLANIQGLNADLAAKQASVVNAQNGVRSLSENSANTRLSDVRRSPEPTQPITDDQLKAFLGTNVLADDFVASAFGPIGGGELPTSSQYQKSTTLDFISGINDRLGASLFGADLLKAGDVGFGLAQSYGRPLGLTISNVFDSGLGFASSSKNSYFAFNAFDSVDNFSESISFAGIADNSFVKGLGDLSTIAGPLLSGYEYYDYSKQTDGKGPDLDLYFGKAVVDTLFAGIGATPQGRFIGGAYGVLDAFVQSKPDYVPTYGTRAGRPVNGWTAIGAQDFDNQVNKVANGTHLFGGPKF